MRILLIIAGAIQTGNVSAIALVWVINGVIASQFAPGVIEWLRKI